MQILLSILALATLDLDPATAVLKAPPPCPKEQGTYLQVLGSGGPIADDGRASSAYIVWIDGKSRVMIDAGGGSFLRFGEADASFEDLDFVGLSHFHTDHSADFPALLKSGYFSGRKRRLVVAGPDGKGLFPGLQEYLNSLLAPETGAYRYLGPGYLDGSGGMEKFRAYEVGADRLVRVYENEARGLTIEAQHVPHGMVPTLGFRTKVGEKTIVFGSDQNGSDARFIDFAKDATMLVMHMPIPEVASGAAVKSHARPSDLGRIAARANVETLVLSHFMARSLRNLDENLDAVRSTYSGWIMVAEDLSCFEIGGR